MTFASDIASVLAEGRAMAESLMQDTAVVTRATGELVTDADGDASTVTTTLYAGKARRQIRAATSESTPEAGGHSFTVQQAEAQFPIGAFAPQVGDVIEWTDTPNDPSGLGKFDRVTGLFAKTHATALRLPVEQIAD